MPPYPDVLVRVTQAAQLPASGCSRLTNNLIEVQARQLEHGGYRRSFRAALQRGQRADATNQRRQAYAHMSKRNSALSPRSFALLPATRGTRSAPWRPGGRRRLVKRDRQ